MNKMMLAWVALAAVLSVRSFVRPSLAVAVYMLTFLVSPRNWWWGDLLEGYRWNFYAGVLLLLVLSLTAGRFNNAHGRPLRSSVAAILFLMALNAIVVHAAFAANPDPSFGWLIARLKVILFFFLVQYAIRDEKDFAYIATAIALGMGYIGYEATINERGHFSGGRLEGIGAAGVEDSNQLAALLITGLPLGMTMLFSPMSRWLKLMVLVSSGLTFNVVLLCNSRGAFLGLLAGGVLFLFMASGPAKKQARRILALSGLAAFLMLGDPQIIQRFLTIFTSDGQRDASAQSRIVFWSAAMVMIRDYPLGSGGNSFSEGRGWRYLGDSNEPTDTRAIHNGYLTEMADWGLQGFVLMLLFCGATWRTLRRGRRFALERMDANAIMVFACIATAFGAWLVSSVFGDYLDNEWGFWAAALGYSYLRVRQSAQAPALRESVVSATTHNGGWAAPLHSGAAR